MFTRKVGAVACIAAALFLLIAFVLTPESGSPTLILKDYQSNQVYLELPLPQDGSFSVSYLHSVNKSIVEEYYQLDTKGNITLVKARQHSFGAGVATTLENDEYLTYDENGYMVINNINRPIDTLVYKVGTTSNHILHIGSDSWQLKAYAPELSSVLFAAK